MNEYYPRKILDLESWVVKLKEPVCFVSFCGEQYTNMSSWKAVRENAWDAIRYDLESEGSGAPGREVYRGFLLADFMRDIANVDLLQKTQFRGLAMQDILIYAHGAFPPLETLKELKQKDFVFKKSFVVIIRTPMPYGGKPFVPLDMNPKYILSTASEQETMRKAFKDIHACDLEWKRTLFMKEWVTYVVPCKTYRCSACGQFGQHMSSCCFLFEKEKGLGTKFGVDKNMQLKPMQEQDAELYAIIHQHNEKKVS